ncbi:hypothetical protein BCEP27_10918 [Burkholderia cepacia]
MSGAAKRDNTADVNSSTVIPSAIVADDARRLPLPYSSKGSSSFTWAFPKDAFNRTGKCLEIKDKTPDLPVLFAPMKKLKVLKGAIVCSVGPIPR